MSRDLDQLADAFWEAAEDADESVVVSAFVKLVENKGMTSRMKSIYAAVEKKGKDIEAKKRAVVKTAYALEGDLKQEIEKDMDAHEVQFKTDEDVIGGLQIQTHDRRISGTIKSFLNNLKRSVLKTQN